MSEIIDSAPVSEPVTDTLTSEPRQPLAAVEGEAYPEKAQRVLQAALDVYSRSPDWVVFFREVVGKGGIVPKAFSGEELALFQRGEEYTRIQEMLVELRVRPKPEDQEVEPTRVITVRLPQTLHEALKAEAHDRETSMNQLCISKLVQLIDERLVPKD